MTYPSPLVIGVGASAGGLEPFQELLKLLGDSPGCTVVFVQHLIPDSQSLLVDLLAGKTAMRVVDLQSQVELQINTVYVCPPQQLIELNNGCIGPVPCSEQRPAAPIDHLFHSIASVQGERGIGVILSGSGSDGALGLKAISDCGGLTFAQDAETARYEAMPCSAATTGVADHVLPPAEIAGELLKYISYLSGQPASSKLGDKHDAITDAIPTIAATLMAATNHNFQHYKPTTLSRRIQRRMQVLKIAGVNNYVKHLQQHEDETRALFRELLIGVTNFFRDADAFASLKEKVLSKLFGQRAPDEPVRIWVAGCANGAEAYSVAILCREVMDELKSTADVQIFATDIDERALAIARAGAYPVGIEEHVTAERLKRFFIKRGKQYQVTNEIRELVLFSAHNLITDPPFSRQNLICCRNLLIYLGPHLQNKLIPLFHYALRPEGFLFLGPSENISSHAELFQAVDAKQRISKRRSTSARTTPSLSQRHSRFTPVETAESNSGHPVDLTAMAQRIVLDEFAPKYAVIDESGQILNSSANLEKYVHFQGGDYQNNLLKMVHSGLRIGLRFTLGEARKTSRKVQHDNLSIRLGDKIQRVMLTVQPMPQLGEDQPLFMVVFHDVGLPVEREAIDHPATQLSDDASTLLVQMELELETTRNDLDKSLQDMEAANEELKSSNEELLSMNEELQSANEELETSKEEIRTGSDAVARAHDDLENLLRSSRIATVFLDKNLNIRSFTPAIAEIYSLISTDVGRPLEKFVPAVKQMPPLPDPRSLHDDQPVEHTVVTNSGKSFIRRVLPYQSHTSSTDGIVVTFTDVTSLRQSEQQFRGTFDNAAVGIAHVALSGQWMRVNQRLCEITGYPRGELLSKTFQEISHPADLQADLKQLKMLVEGKITTYSLEKRYLRKPGGTVWVNLTVSLVHDDTGQPDYTIAVIEDIDDKVRNRDSLTQRERQLSLALDAGKMGTFRWQLEPEVLEWSDQMYTLYGVEKSGQAVTSDAFLRLLHPADREATVKNWQQEFASDARDHTSEFRLIRPVDNQTIWVHGRGLIERDEHGKALSVTGVVIDITHRKQTEIATADREAHLRRVINNQLGLVGVIDQDGHLVEVDDRSIEIARVRREDVIGKHFADAPWWNYDPAVSQQMREAMQQAFAGDAVRFDVSLFAHGDKGVMIDFMMAPVKNEAGEVEYLIPSGVDIRDRKRSELALRQANERLDISMAAGNIAPWRWNLATGEFTGSNLFLEHFGCAPDSKPTPEELFAQIDDADRERVFQAVQKSIDENTDYFEQYRISTAPGHFRWIRAHGRAILDDAGNAVDFIGITIDETSKRIDERNLAFRASLLEEISAVETPGVMLEIVTRRVAEYFNADRCCLVDIDSNSGVADVTCDYCGDLPSLTGRHAIADFMTPAEQNAIAAGTAVRIDDIYNAGKSSSQVQRFEELSIRSIAEGIYERSQHFRQSLIVTRAEPFHWRDDQLEFLKDLAGLVSLSVERVKSRADLRAANAKLSAMFQQSVYQIGIINLDGVLTDINPAAAIPLGYAEEDMLNKLFWDSPLFADQPDVQTIIRDNFFRALEGHSFQDVITFTFPDGSRGYSDFVYTPATDVDGEVMFVIATGNPVTERVESQLQLESLLREHEITKSRMTAAADAAGFGMLHVDLRTQEVTFSKEIRRLAGWPEDAELDVAAGEMPDFIHPDDVEICAQHFETTITSPDENVPALEHRIVMPHGEVRWVRLTTRKLFDDQHGDSGGGMPTQLIGTMVDITQQHDYEQQLKQSRQAAEAASESKSSFVANMSHEIRTPMTAILGYTKILEEFVEGDEPRRHLETIRRNGDFLLDIINDILDLSKIEAGKMEITSERFSLTHLIEDVRSIMEVRANEKRLKLTVDYRGELPESIHSDPKRLKQVLINLVGNAIKFTREGTVDVVVEFLASDPASVRISVIDSGIGMSAKQQQKLFMPFSQGDASVTREFGGTGLGLAISRRLAEMLGGVITVESELGRGSRFSLTIAAGDLTDTATVDPESISTVSPQPEAVHEEAPPQLDCNILLVDDRRDVRFLSNRILSKLGATLTEATDGLLAIEAVERAEAAGQPFDLILMDMQMPNLDGYGAAERLRKMGFNKPIIALTADAMQGDMKRCLECGCNDYLSKPIDVELLIEMVRRFTT